MEKFMQRVFTTLGATLLLLFILMIGKYCYNEYFGIPDNRYNQEQYAPDTVRSPSQVIMFTTADEAVITHEYMVNETSTNDLFLDIPPGTVQLIAQAMINSRGSCTIQDIVAEYRANGLIYNTKNRQQIDIPLPVDTGVPLKPDERQLKQPKDSIKTPPNT